MGLLGGYCETDEERAAIEQRDRDYMEAHEAAKRIAELENAIAQHKLRQWGGDGVEVSNDADAALYAHVKL